MHMSPLHGAACSTTIKVRGGHRLLHNAAASSEVLFQLCASLLMCLVAAGSLLQG